MYSTADKHAADGPDIANTVGKHTADKLDVDNTADIHATDELDVDNTSEEKHAAHGLDLYGTADKHAADGPDIDSSEEKHAAVKHALRKKSPSGRDAETLLLICLHVAQNKLTIKHIASVLKQCPRILCITNHCSYPRTCIYCRLRHVTAKMNLFFIKSYIQFFLKGVESVILNFQLCSLNSDSFLMQTYLLRRNCSRLAGLPNEHQQLF